MFNIIVQPRVEKFIKGLDRNLRNRVLSAVLELTNDARPPGCVKVKSEEGVWRIRVGDYRIGYIINDATGTITIIRVGHRSDFYE